MTKDDLEYFKYICNRKSGIYDEPSFCVGYCVVGIEMGGVVERGREEGVGSVSPILLSFNFAPVTQADNSIR